MKRVIEELKEELATHQATAIGVRWDDLPRDIDLTDCDVSIMNVLHDDCHLLIKKVDDRYNVIQIFGIPPFIRELFYLSHMQGTEECCRLLSKLRYENECVRRDRPIGYDNTIG